jgi:hypothetical protein
MITFQTQKDKYYNISIIVYGWGKVMKVEGGLFMKEKGMVRGAG